MNNFAIYVKLVDNDRLLIKKILLDRAEKRKRGDSMKWHPLVSVILPTWNRAKYLPQAMDSVLSQDYKNLELFVVDDGSTDETGQIVNSYKDDRICYIRTSAELLRLVIWEFRVQLENLLCSRTATVYGDREN